MGVLGRRFRDAGCLDWTVQRLDLDAFVSWSCDELYVWGDPPTEGHRLSGIRIYRDPVTSRWFVDTYDLFFEIAVPQLARMLDLSFYEWPGELMQDLKREFPDSPTSTGKGQGDAPAVDLAVPSVPPDGPTLVLQGPGEPVMVCGRIKTPPTPAEYDVLRKLVAAYPKGVKKSVLKGGGKRPGAISTFNYAKRRDLDYYMALCRPGRRDGDGYRIRAFAEIIAVHRLVNARGNNGT